MPRPREVEITKGDLKAKVLKESVAAWKRNGWTVADDGSSDEAPAPVEEPQQAPAKKAAAKKTATKEG